MNVKKYINCSSWSILWITMYIMVACCYLIQNKEESIRKNVLKIQQNKINIHANQDKVYFNNNLKKIYKRRKRFVGLIANELAVAITGCKESAFYPSTCVYREELKKIARELMVAKRIFDVIAKRQRILNKNLAHIKDQLVIFQKNIPSFFKYIRPLLEITKLTTVSDYNEYFTNYEAIERLLNEKENVIPLIVKTLTLLNDFLLTSKPRPVKLFLSNIFNAFSITMIVMNQKDVNQRMKSIMHDANHGLNQSRYQLIQLENSTRHLFEQWKKMEHLIKLYGSDLKTTYLTFRNIMPNIFIYCLPPDIKNITSSSSVLEMAPPNIDHDLNIETQDFVFQDISLEEQLGKHIRSTRYVLHVLHFINEFINLNIERIKDVFAKFYNNENFANQRNFDEILAIISSISHEIKGGSSTIKDLIDACMRQSLKLNRTEAIKLVSLLIPSKKCYGLYPLGPIREGKLHFTYELDIDEVDLNHIRDKAKHDDYPVKKFAAMLGQKYNRLFSSEEVYYILAYVLREKNVYMGNDLTPFKTCLNLESSDNVFHKTTAMPNLKSVYDHHCIPIPSLKVREF